MLKTLNFYHVHLTSFHYFFLSPLQVLKKEKILKRSEAPFMESKFSPCVDRLQCKITEIGLNKRCRALKGEHLNFDSASLGALKIQNITEFLHCYRYRHKISIVLYRFCKIIYLLKLSKKFTKISILTNFYFCNFFLSICCSFYSFLSIFYPIFSDVKYLSCD